MLTTRELTITLALAAVIGIDGFTRCLSGWSIIWNICAGIGVAVVTILIVFGALAWVNSIAEQTEEDTSQTRVERYWRERK